jgi:hypothetical protein
VIRNACCLSSSISQIKKKRPWRGRKGRARRERRGIRALPTQ